MAEPAILRCSHCGLPFATVANGVLTVEAKHHGEKHTCSVSLAELLLLANPDKVREIAPALQAAAKVYSESRAAMAAFCEQNGLAMIEGTARTDQEFISGD